MPFENLTREVYGAYDKRLEFKDPRKNPVFMAGTKRLQSDLVLFLALIHHLVLGGIVDLEVNQILLKMAITKKCFVLEYVGLDDSLVKLNPSSFTQNRENYSLDNILKEGKKYFREVEIFDSMPSTRKMLVFTK